MSNKKEEFEKNFIDNSNEDKEEDEVIFTMDEIKPKEEKPKKQRKKRPPLTEEAKERLRLQLQKGRETAKKNRQKRAEYKKLMKEKERKKIDDVLEEDYKKRNSKKEQHEKLNREIEDLRNKLKFFQDKEIEKEKEVNKVIKEEKKAEQPKKEETIKEEIDDSFMDEKPKIVNQPPPPKPKVFSNRIKMGSRWKR